MDKEMKWWVFILWSEFEISVSNRIYKMLHYLNFLKDVSILTTYILLHQF
jgi:hypothetical protein